MLKVYEDKNYLSEDGSYITTPQIDSFTEISIGFGIALLGLILPMIGVICGL